MAKTDPNNRTHPREEPRFELYYRDSGGNPRDAELWSEILGLDSENVIDIAHPKRLEVRPDTELPKADPQY
jgi:hypothetical protein